MSIEAGISLDLHLGQIADRLEQFLTRSEQFARYALPQDFSTNADATSATYTVLPFPAVPAGRIWDVRRVAVSAAGTSGDPFTTLTSALPILIKNTSMRAQSTGSATQGQGFTTNQLDGSPTLILDTLAWLANAGRVPASSLFSRGTVVLKPFEQIMVVVKSASSGVHMIADLAVESYPIELFRQA